MDRSPAPSFSHRVAARLAFLVGSLTCVTAVLAGEPATYSLKHVELGSGCNAARKALLELKAHGYVVTGDCKAIGDAQRSLVAAGPPGGVREVVDVTLIGSPLRVARIRSDLTLNAAIGRQVEEKDVLIGLASKFGLSRSLQRHGRALPQLAVTSSTDEPVVAWDLYVWGTEQEGSLLAHAARLRGKLGPDSIRGRFVSASELTFAARTPSSIERRILVTVEDADLMSVSDRIGAGYANVAHRLVLASGR